MGSGNTQLDVTNQPAAADVDAAVRLVARHYYGARGVWAYEAFDYINAAYFAGELPTPAIQWGITPHGGCLGLTTSSARPPVVTLHPSLLGGSEKVNPWGVSPALLGVAYAFDVLIHECIHVNVEYLRGGWRAVGDSSHNNPQWIGEVNRLAPLVGLVGVEAGLSKARRIPIEDAEPTARGKQPTRVVRGSTGNLPHKAMATFPAGVRHHFGWLDVYREDTLPFTPSVGIGGRNAQLDVTETGGRATGDD